MKYLIILILLWTPLQFEAKLQEAWSLVYKAQEMGLDVNDIRSQLEGIQEQLQIRG